MKTISFLMTMATFLFTIPTLALDAGIPAPDFTLMGNDGKSYKLSDYRGKFVVLEWFNNDCPFVKKHYQSKNMQSLQKRFTDQGVAWFSIVSSASGKQGHVNQEDAQQLKQQNESHQTAILLDTQGSVGKSYEAKTTPHMYLIGKSGQLLYQGAIDDKSSADTDDIEGARNYIAEAIEASLAGKPVQVATTRPYGCSVKY